jgi:ABC-type lipoprotein release transport system permease subunit
MHGPKLSVMAWRNLWRNRRRTLITVFAIVFGVLLAVLFTGLSNASLDDAVDTAARLGSGHVTLQHPEYLETPSTKRSVTGVADLERRMRAVPGVKAVVHRVTGALMLATAAQSQGAQFIAYDPRVETPATLPLLEAVPPAERLQEAGGQGIVLGAALAENLNATVGRKVVYTLTDKRGEIVTGLARVSGILKTGTQGIDGNVCLLPIDAVRTALGYGDDEATFVGAFLDDNRKSDAVANRLRAEVPAGVAVLTWSEVMPDIAAFVAVKMGGLVVMELVMLLLTGAGIFNTLLVSVMERLREFGILMAIGFSPWQLSRLVLWESLWLGLGGVVSGLAVTALPYWLMATRGISVASMTGGKKLEVAGVGVSTQMFAHIHNEAAVGIVVVILLATLVSGLYPAWRAGRVVPVESIKLV